MSESFSAEEVAQIDAEIRAARKSRSKASQRTTGLVLLIGSIFGFIASFALIQDKIALIRDPNAQLLCDINPFISCGKFIETWQGSTFGFPNMYLGLAGFAIMGAIGSLHMSGAQLPRWFHWATFGGLAFAFGFVVWLSSNALFAIHALCPWCLVVWAVTAPMLACFVAYMVESGILTPSGVLEMVARSWVLWALAWYVLVVVAAFIVFFPQWMAMLSA